MANEKRGQGNNQSAASDLTIPTIGQSAGPIVQPGEDAEALTKIAGAAPELDSFIAEANKPAPVVQSDAGEQNEEPAQFRGVTQPREMTIAEMQAAMVEMQKTMSMLVSTMARNNPVHRRHDEDQQAETPRMSFELPTTGDIKDMRRPDQRVQSELETSPDMDHAAMMAFLDEYVVINIHETGEQGAENPVPLYINGRAVAIMRGQDTAVKRKYVELLLRAKPESMTTRLERGPNGEVKNHIDKTRALKYPFSIVVDRNPRGRAWAQKIRMEA